ncbi:MAG: high-potential iron-sulfur protein [Lunatimonas sp.]|uniref:high-potential iron-sulfur protein n=1 Tax=Lunatimonas sp. TaxID=2060141 RepID=UPI00263A8A3B|nr:high-potential iron-sulfur protein [Lunatimonas sp.]MCC5938127.1 high-potential iron-sulfur protein [Lunatimonas sp.]
MHRRKVLKNLIQRGSAWVVLPLIAACSGGSSESSKEYDLASITDCTDLNGLPEEEVSKRSQLGYVEKTPISDNNCDNCQLYLPPTETRKCGGCQLFKGPVKPEAYCTYWAPRVDHG